MTIPTEVAAVLAEMRELKVPNWPAGRILGGLADRLEAALTKAEAVEAVAEVYEWHTCGRDALGEAYRQSKGVAMRFIGPALPIGTKLYAHAVPVESPSNDALDADRFRWLRDHAINTEGAKGSPWCVYGLHLGDCTPTFGAELVAFVDDAMANGIVCSPVPVESLGRAAPAESPASVPDGSAYSLAEIQHAWDAAVEQGDWEDFQANLYTPTNQEGAAP